MDVVIAIGHDGAGVDFAGQVTKVIRLLGTLNAVVEGPSWSPEWGSEQASWFAASFPDFDTYIEARARILAVGAAHAQDAVAFTVGQVDVADCPRAERAGYRDFL